MKKQDETQLHGRNVAKVDDKLAESGLSPNELDRSDESEKAQDITQAGKKVASASEPSQARAQMAKTSERYAG